MLINDLIAINWDGLQLKNKLTDIIAKHAPWILFVERDLYLRSPLRLKDRQIVVRQGNMQAGKSFRQLRNISNLITN